MLFDSFCETVIVSPGTAHSRGPVQHMLDEKIPEGAAEQTFLEGVSGVRGTFFRHLQDRGVDASLQFLW